MIRKFSVLASLFFLTGCASPLLQMLPGGAGESLNKATIAATANAVRGECSRALLARQSYRDAVNRELTAMGLTNRVLALDCDGDDQPDF